MMGLGKPKRLAKFEVAGFIYYGNIRKLVFKIWDKPKWGNPLLYGETVHVVKSRALAVVVKLSDSLRNSANNYASQYKDLANSNHIISYHYIRLLKLDRTQVNS